jgi:hypothetical protein
VITAQNNHAKQIQINGPRNGRVGELLHPEPLSARLLSLLVRMARTGGADQGGLVGARGASLMLNDTGLEAQASVCLEEGALPKIVIAPGSKDTFVFVTDRQGTKSAPLTFASQQVPWPATVPIKDGALYRLIPNNSPWVEIKIRIVPKGSLGDVTAIASLDALEQRNCNRQVNDAVNKIVAQQ